MKSIAIVLVVVAMLLIPSNVYAQSADELAENMRNAIGQQEGDECFFGPAHLKRTIQPTLTGRDIEYYNDTVRQEEIKTYIDENKDTLNIPESMNNDVVLCAVAMDVKDYEKEVGKTFEGKDLEANVKLAIIA